MDIDGGGASAEHNHLRAEQEFLFKEAFFLREILKILLGQNLCWFTKYENDCMQ